MSTPSTSPEPPLKRVNGPPADLSECRERLIRFCYSIALLATARKSVNSSSRSFFSFAATLHMCVVPSAPARIFTSKPRDWFLSGSREEITIISIFQAINSDCLLRCFVSLLNVKREEEKKLLNIKNEKEYDFLLERNISCLLTILHHVNQKCDVSFYDTLWWQSFFRTVIP